MLNFKNFIKESVINREKDQNIFNYNGLLSHAWNSLVHEAQDFFKIHFDLENNESENEKKTIYIKRNLRKDQPIKYEFNCELFEAGGDWEMPVQYFRVEFTYSIPGTPHWDNPEYIFDLKRDLTKDKYLSDMNHKYVFIPGIEDGNFLIKTDKGYRAYTDEDLVKDGLKWKDVRPDHKKGWKWIENLLEEIVEKRHEMLD